VSDELDQMIRSYGDELGRAQRLEHPRRGLPVRRIALAGAVAGLALGIGVAVLPGSDPGDAVAQAKDVLTPDNQIIHVITEQRVNIPGNRLVTKSESWIAENRERTVTGDLEFASVLHPGKRRTVKIGDHRVRAITGRFDQYNRKTNQYRYYLGFSLPGMETPRDPVAEVRKLLAAGQLEDAGTTTVNGREVRRLISNPEQHTTTIVGGRTLQVPSFPAEYRVDAKTFAPIEFRVAEETRVYKLFERLPRNAETEKLLRIDVPADAQRRMLR